MSTQAYDMIVIGSGMGGLTVASLMAQLAGKRVLVLERHYRLGGFTHAFTRPDGFRWDVGLHYVGGMKPGDQARGLMDFITGGAVDWQAMPAPFESFSYPGFDFDVPVGRDAYLQALVARFPAERRAIERYFRDVERAAQWAGNRIVMPALPWFVAGPMRALSGSDALPLSTTRAYLDAHFTDPLLKAVLASQWGDYGLPPAQSSFAIHAVIAQHYFDGAWYPVGGAGEITVGARRMIEAAGGRCLVNQSVSEILLEDGRAVGVRVDTHQGEHTYFAPFVVSNAGAHATFERLLPASVPLPFRDELKRIEPGYAVATLYLGLKDSPERIGLKGGNRWIYTGLDHDDLFAHRGAALEGRPNACYLSFPSQKDPRARAHTAEIITSLDYSDVARWKAQPWRQRDEAYAALKATIAEGLLDLVEAHHPGFRELVALQELSTPLSVEHFTGHRGGGIYGVPATPDRFRRSWLTAKTPVQGLYLTGTDAGMLGIVGALMGGVVTAATLLGPTGFVDILRRSQTPVRAAAVA